MAVIRVLDKHTAELIAAGEVVERPASAAKELIENAIDAGATQIAVSIESGGVKLIEVSDNGSGIEPEYVSTAFIRHATSKIEDEIDLAAIRTLGFRGEALSSIASVSKVELLTRTASSEFAVLYRNEGGEEFPIEPAARAVGTTIRVRDLFYNTPARMKFLKKDSSEGTYVADIVDRLALSHPEISFKFVREGKQQYVTPGDGDLRGAAYAVLGREFARDLIEIDKKQSIYRLHGLITPPRKCRASRSMEFFYINGRYVRNPTMMAGLEMAFKHNAMQGRFPGCILMLDMPVELLDVNVHPAKTAVRFACENNVFEAIYHMVMLALKEPGSGERGFVLGGPWVKGSPYEEFANKNTSWKDNDDTKENDVKDNDFTGLSAVIPGQAQPGALPYTPDEADETDEEEGEMPAPPAVPAKPSGWGAPLQESLALHSTPAEKPASSFRPAGQESQLDVTPDWEDEEALPQQEALFPDEDEPEQTVMPGAEDPNRLEYVGEAFRTYIIAQRGDELYLIDKHAAHERQIYEELAAEYGEIPCQLLITPLVVSLSAEEKDALLYNSALLENVGVVMEDYGGNSILMRTTPADVEPKDLEDLAVELADKLVHGSPDALSEHTEWVLHSVACRAAIKAGDHTSPEELMVLAEKILSGKVPPTCPHGRPCVLKLTRKELEKQFGRIE